VSLPPRCAPLPPRGRGRHRWGRFFERDGQSNPLFDRHLFRSALEVERLRCAARVEPAADGVAQQLPPLREPDRDELAQQRRIDVVADRQRRHPQHRRVDSRRRLEGFGRNIEQTLDPIAPLQHHGEPAEVLGPGLGGDAVDDLLLQHEVLVLDGTAGVEKMEQDRRRDVVGQVADDAQLSTRHRGRQGREIDIEHVGLDHVEARGAAEPDGQVAIELDDGECLAALEQRTGQRAAARPDLDQGLSGTRVDRADDPVDHRSVDEEVLPEPLPGVLHG
jgi:hypothetical protein